MVELLYATGVRVGELAGMDVDDLDPDRRTLRVLGKGNKERTVPYGLPAALAVDDWLRRGRPALATGTSGPALFLGARGGRVDQRQVRSVVKEMLEAAGGHRRHRAARPAALRSHPPARRRGRPARGAGNPRATAAWPPPRSTPTCPSRGSGRATSRRTPGPEDRRPGASGRPERRTIRPGFLPGIPPADLPGAKRTRVHLQDCRTVHGAPEKTRRIALA